MDQNQHSQPTRKIGPQAPTNPPTRRVGPSIPSPYPIKQEYDPQYIYPSQEYYLQQKLNNFWAKQRQEIKEIVDFRTHSVPLARIKKIMKADEDARMISAEAPVVFAKACEMFILELSLKAWTNVKDNKKRVLKKSDIVFAISTTDVFDFLDDNIILRNDTMVDHQVFASIARNGVAPTNNVSYYYTPPHEHVASPLDVPRIPMGSPVLDQNHHELQTHSFPTTIRLTSNQRNHLPNSDG